VDNSGAEADANLVKNDQLLTQIWASVSAAGGSAQAHGISMPLLEAFNEIINLDTERKVAWRLRVPAGVLILLLAYLVVTAGELGYIVEGARGKRAALMLFVLIALLVISHWFLDWITHRPDMPLYPGGPKYGLGLWNSVPATIAIETTMFAIGVAIYLSATRAVNAKGRWTLWGLVGLILAADVGSIMGPPPPSVSALIATAIAGVIVLLGLSWWADSSGLRRAESGHAR
jgi:hypothetical protein